MKTGRKPLFESDEHSWMLTQIKALREGRKIDAKHVLQLFEDMAKRDTREIDSRMRVLAMHLLKKLYTEIPGRENSSWRRSIIEQRRELESIVDSNVLRRHGVDNFLSAYSKARKDAAAETGKPLKLFPEAPPFSFEQMLDFDYLMGGKS
jgi:hypothetical protein